MLGRVVLGPSGRGLNHPPPSTSAGAGAGRARRRSRGSSAQQTVVKTVSAAAFGLATPAAGGAVRARSRSSSAPGGGSLHLATFETWRAGRLEGEAHADEAESVDGAAFVMLGGAAPVVVGTLEDSGVRACAGA
jgi:hypothetical protein